MSKTVNKNDAPLSSIDELRGEISYADFEFKQHFVHLCLIKPEISKERIVLEPVATEKISEKGLVYVLCIGGKIFKIGCTITAFEKRVQSYNCGKKAFRASGTCSTTNYFILQSILSINQTVDVHAYFPKMMQYTIFGHRGEERFPSPKAVDKEILKRFMKKHSRLPVGCAQK